MQGLKHDAAVEPLAVEVAALVSKLELSAECSHIGAAERLLTALQHRVQLKMPARESVLCKSASWPS